jgi:hypothetical protein
MKYIHVKNAIKQTTYWVTEKNYYYSVPWHILLNSDVSILVLTLIDEHTTYDIITESLTVNAASYFVRRWEKSLYY